MKVWKHLCAISSAGSGRRTRSSESGPAGATSRTTSRRPVSSPWISTRRCRGPAAPHVTPVVGDCTDLARFESGSFDVVFASNLLEHLERPASSRLLSEARRVLQGRRAADPHAAQLPAQPRPLLRRLHTSRSSPTSPCRTTSCQRAGRSRTMARFLPLTLVPGFGSDVPRAVVPALAVQALGGADAGRGRTVEGICSCGTVVARRGAPHLQREGQHRRLREAVRGPRRGRRGHRRQQQRG